MGAASRGTFNESWKWNPLGGGTRLSRNQLNFRDNAYEEQERNFAALSKIKRLSSV